MLRLVSNKAKFPEHLVISRFCQCCYNIPRNLVSYTSTPKTVMNTQNMPGREIDLLETKDTRFRLPGSVGIFVNETWLNKLRQFDDATNVKKSTVLTNDELLKNLNDDKPMLNTSTIEEEEKENLQCIAHECPTLLIKDFQELFPRNRANILNGLTVLTISQKSQNDMSVWSIQVNIEREKLIAKYVSIAEKMCNFLKENGYWADFIDPSSGRLFDVCNLETKIVFVFIILFLFYRENTHQPLFSKQMNVTEILDLKSKI